MIPYGATVYSITTTRRIVEFFHRATMHPRTTRFRITFIHLRIPSQDDICRVQREHGEAARRREELPLPEGFKVVYSTIAAYLNQLKPCLTFSERNQCT